MNTNRDLRLALDGEWLEARLTLPEQARGLVVFVHGSGSGRQSPRNCQVAAQFNGLGLATLLFDLLSVAEQRLDNRTCELRFDIELLTRRLLALLDWLAAEPELRDLPLGLFGASTGAATALRAAAERPSQVRAVVSRGGRTDLADAVLGEVRAAVLMIAGGADPFIVQANRESLRRLGSECDLQTVPGATHLFEEPGALEQVARLAGAWFVRYLAG
ncbi:hypothetical protein PKB_2763 [Pseudomonas knackmussii B13]|uniref:Dienelactone hydrolase domain-containing protein n=1 Tax=Pseudomonas knackmussii (strain DSM 6978 / CCUG 54928 / LMG 23759 / B13) TaxID=1301098 RepID=A0A024HGH2_PSEKB|nr:alpha/beta family hydrolase [Pseudomonas knackmussii]CDF84110.1 hypothetical protein PKB_2763 [Pseudomonas knackmussii B13]